MNSRKILKTLVNFALGATLLYSMCVNAEWIAISAAKEGFFYIETENSVKSLNGNVKAWTRLEYSQAKFINARLISRSMRTLDEYDCAKPRYRTLTFSSYTGKNMTGEVTTENKRNEWEFIPSNSVFNTARAIACEYMEDLQSFPRKTDHVTLIVETDEYAEYLVTKTLNDLKNNKKTSQKIWSVHIPKDKPDNYTPFMVLNEINCATEQKRIVGAIEGKDNQLFFTLIKKDNTWFAIKDKPFWQDVCSSN